MQRVAGIDCGTNSIRLLIADYDAESGGLQELKRVMRIVRLGQGVDTTGKFAPEAMDRTNAALSDYHAMLEEYGVSPEHTRFVATSAARDAKNGAVFMDAVRDKIGVPAEIISGDEEAALSFNGAKSALDETDGSCLVVDLGGGSTELVLGKQSVDAAFSMDIGSVRLTERHLRADPPTDEQIAAAIKDADAAIAEAEKSVPLAQTARIVGVAGTVTTLTGVALGHDHYRRDALSGAQVSIADHLATCDKITHMSVSERLATGVVHRGRADVLGGGALIWRQILRRVQELTGIDSALTSEHDILDGIALSAAERL